jgi:hypothetical protein
MHNIVFSKIVLIISKVNFVVVSVDEVILLMLKIGSISMMKNSKHITILLTFKRVEVRATLDKIKVFILDTMGKHGAL